MPPYGVITRDLFMSGPLSGLTVVEMAAIGPVPLVGQLMADLGATVVIVDRKSSSAEITDINRRNKRSVAINLKSKQGRDVFLQLLKSADILIEGFRPGTMENLSIGPAECQQHNARLIYGRMTGWGQEGPLSKTAGHDINYLAITGALQAIGLKDKPPVPPLNLVADYAGGAMFLVMGVLAALHERQQSGKGQVIDAAMIDGVPSIMGFIQNLYHQQLWSPQRQSNMLDGGAPYYRCYQTADNKYISVGAIEPRFYKIFIELSGLPESELAIQNERERWPEINARFEKHFKFRTRDAWMQLFDGSDACVAPVLDFNEAPHHPHNRDRSVFRDERLEASPAPRFNRTPAPTPKAAVAQGSSTDEVLAELDFDAKTIQHLRDIGALT